jgi:hypothetical protein
VKILKSFIEMMSLESGFQMNRLFPGAEVAIRALQTERRGKVKAERLPRTHTQG